jgi:predicted PhzF superfamily epimerase YddE/YHI9
LDPVVCLQVDAFTDRPFSGNPAAVCLLEEGRDSEWMQAVAAEMNLSETAFVWPVGDGFDLRWFTPAVEVDLCGHATLAAAHALWSEGLVPGEGRISFRTRSGLLTAARRGDLIELDFPATSRARRTCRRIRLPISATRWASSRTTWADRFSISWLLWAPKTCCEACALISRGCGNLRHGA